LISRVGRTRRGASRRAAARETRAGDARRDTMSRASPSARSIARAGARTRAGARARSFRRARVAALTKEDVEFMVENFKPWVTDEESARKCDAYMREKHASPRAFNLEKARAVLESLKADHAKLPEAAGPFSLPKTWPGMSLVLERCGDSIE